ncbi:MAG: hypothetical protein E7173_00585 [Firmicutes bacterium]|nr:hypothetical protein [Bacillota bacterium]
MNKKEFLTEENYEKSKKKISKMALIILIIGILLGGSLIVAGLVKRSQTNNKYSEESKNAKIEQLTAQKEQISDEVDSEKQNLITAKTTLENKIKPVEDQIKKLEREPFTGFNDAYYEREDKIDALEESIKADKKNIGVIDDALDESFNHCNFYEAKNNVYTSKYCSLKKQLEQKTSEIYNVENDFSDFKKEFESHDAVPFFMFGTFIIIASGMIAFAIFMFTKRREMLAFTAQQIMPVAQEGIEKMAPTIGSAMGTVGKELAKGMKDGLETMTPAIGNAMGTMGKEIAKGIKEGLNEAENNKE